MELLKKVCKNCNSSLLIKSGITKEKKQRYKCKCCNKRFITNYTYQACKRDINAQIVLLIKEGLGIRSISRVLQISTTTLLKRIVLIADTISRPSIFRGKTYEVDEIRSFVHSKDHLIWIVYAFERESKRVVSFSVGRRTKQTLDRVVTPLILSDSKSIFTDKLKQYKYLINSKIHKIKKYGTNHIERNHLTIRTHIKRLNRRTICFSRSLAILFSILKIYFWY